MLFKMILDGAKDEERAIARGFLKHIVAGIAAGLAFGGLVLVCLFIVFAKLELQVPLIFLVAALLQFGPIGGLIGAAIHLSRISERTSPASDDEEDDGPGGGTKSPVVFAPDPSKRAPQFSAAPSPG
jgi:hypothetical protein